MQRDFEIFHALKEELIEELKIDESDNPFK